MTTKMSMLGLAALIGVLGTHPASAEDRHIAVLQSLTGGAAFIGVNFSAGAGMAADDLNAANFLGEGNKITYEVLDDATDRTQTLSLMTRLAADERSLIVLGPTSGAVALSAASIANERSLPMIAVTSAMEIPRLGPWSFILTQPAQIQIEDLVEFVANKVGAKRCAVIGLRDNEAYVELQREFETRFKARGLEVPSVDVVASTDTDFSAIATKLASAQQDCIFISTPAQVGANLIVQMRNAGLDPETKIFGHNGFASPVLVQTGGPAVEGVYLTGIWVPGGGANEDARSFHQRFVARFGYEPDNWHALGYAGMQLVANAVREAGDNPTRRGVRDALAASKDVKVIAGSGLYDFVDDRVPSYGTNILMVKDGVFVSAQE